jgi:hypothetical protein
VVDDVVVVFNGPDVITGNMQVVGILIMRPPAV